MCSSVHFAIGIPQMVEQIELFFGISLQSSMFDIFSFCLCVCVCSTMATMKMKSKSKWKVKFKDTHNWLLAWIGSFEVIVLLFLCFFIFIVSQFFLVAPFGFYEMKNFCVIMWNFMRFLVLGFVFQLVCFANKISFQWMTTYIKNNINLHNFLISVAIFVNVHNLKWNI